jgi:hypothetical protein
VEYYDGGSDHWQLEYDGVGGAYSTTLPVNLGNTKQWKRQTFYIPDAYFDGRQNYRADLRLSDLYWDDGQTNYFGRVWISKSAPANRAPDLVGLGNHCPLVGQTVDIPISATDPDGHPLSLTLERSAPFVSLTDNGNGTGTLRLAPTPSDSPSCVYSVRILATDEGSPAMADAVTIQVPLCQQAIFLPTIMGGD